ncbi:hypothetical protein M472_15305 [Sphingobacterium paucimobilis HER1398]|uniref:Uncharacterized protein n=1 Tax=Sphingobacterium paucimobilis HER1398 TaxID=1346330 RepID=U2HEF1_9SPHI|nr:hypothetical protein [Sphingobacterium paucimobilis]ERJ60131.1 hypothetical protein M472_15305 [Sphingobacterium paucimobilis HER1398]
MIGKLLLMEIFVTIGTMECMEIFQIVDGITNVLRIEQLPGSVLQVVFDWNSRVCVFPWAAFNPSANCL